jgi:hypothetical protein
MSYGGLGKFAHGPIPIAAFAQILVGLSSIANVPATQSLPTRYWMDALDVMDIGVPATGAQGAEGTTIFEEDHGTRDRERKERSQSQ